MNIALILLLTVTFLMGMAFGLGIHKEGLNLGAKKKRGCGANPTAENYVKNFAITLNSLKHTVISRNCTFHVSPAMYRVLSDKPCRLIPFKLFGVPVKIQKGLPFNVGTFKTEFGAPISFDITANSDCFDEVPDEEQDIVYRE